VRKGNIEFEQDIQSYVLGVSLRESDLLRRLRKETQTDAAAIMQIPAEQGQFMAMLVKLMGAKRTIEIGVYTGYYSTLCVAEAMPHDSYTIACDVDEDWTNIAKRYWREAGVDQKIDLQIAPARETLKRLIDDNQSGSFDFIFIDAERTK